jgi:hypothetical protein
MSDQPPGRIVLESEEYDVSKLKDFLTRPGCLLWILGLLLIFGIFVSIRFLTDDPTPTNDAADPPPGTSTECVDATQAFLAAGNGDGPVDRLCWEPSGALRAESGLSIDVEPGSAPMRRVCSVLSDFVAASGRDWHGFTLYSTHQAFSGKVIMTSTEPGQCNRP